MVIAGWGVKGFCIQERRTTEWAEATERNASPLFSSTGSWNAFILLGFSFDCGRLNCGSAAPRTLWPLS